MAIHLMTNPPDPILDEIHKTRRELLKEHGSVAGLAAFLREEEAKSQRTIAEPSRASEPNKSVNPSGGSGGF